MPLSHDIYLELAAIHAVTLQLHWEKLISSWDSTPTANRQSWWEEWENKTPNRWCGLSWCQVWVGCETDFTSYRDTLKNHTIQHHPMHLEKEHPNFEHLHWAPNAPLAAQSWGPPKAASQPPKIPADGHSVSKKSEAPSDTLYIYNYIHIHIYIYTTYNVHIGNYPSWQIWLQKIQICRSSGNLLILRRASNWPVLQLSQTTGHRLQWAPNQTTEIPLQDVTSTKSPKFRFEVEKGDMEEECSSKQTLAACQTCMTTGPTKHQAQGPLPHQGPAKCSHLGTDEAYWLVLSS